MFKIFLNKSRRLFVFSVAGLVLSGCASSFKSSIREVTVTPPEAGYVPNSHYGHVSTPHNAAVQKWIDYFTGRGRRHMQVYLERSSRYIPMMKGVFRERGMPEELVYIALIESGFSPMAFSHASAVGYWQFIRGTGVRYNLKIDAYVDERRDPILSTQSAANYLDTLYGMFGDWHLALASYNAGENRIARAVKKYRTRDFWELYAINRSLPAETKNYIPKFIAAVFIAKSPESYGFTNINFQPEFNYESIKLTKPISLELLSQETGISYDDLKRMNPRYKSDFVPLYSDRENAIRIPKGTSQVALAALDKAFAEAPRRYVASFEYYKVRPGDTLSGIARKYRTSIARIRDLNDWNHRNTFIRAGQKIKVPDSAPVANEKKRNDQTFQTKSQANNTAKKSQKTNIQQASQVNRSQSPQTRQKTNSTSHRNTASASSVRRHVVRRGENLTLIARRYSVSVGDITRANQMRSGEVLFVGRSIVIPD